MRTLALALGALLPLQAGFAADVERKARAQKPAKSSCEEQKRRYRESEACFARYRRPDKSLRPEAFGKCVELKQPEC